jgi:hypothetical protein
MNAEDELEAPQPQARPLHPKPSDFKHALGAVNTFNEKIAVFTVNFVGSMWCAYAFGVLAIAGIPAAISSGYGIVQWFASTFLQLVLLSVIIVGQNVQARAADQRAAETYELAKQMADIVDQATEQQQDQIRMLQQALANPRR